MNTLLYEDIYLSEEGNKYPVRIINEYGKFYDVELDPEVENTTLFKVAKYFILKGQK